MYILYILYICTTYILRILRITSCDPLCDFAYHSLLHSSIGFIVARATSTNSLSSALSSCNTCLIRSVTPAEAYKHDYHVFTYTSSILKSRHSHTASPFFLCGINIIYCTAFTRNYIHLAGGRPVMSLLTTYLYTTLPNSLDLLHTRYFFYLPLYIF